MGNPHLTAYKYIYIYICIYIYVCFFSPSKVNQDLAKANERSNMFSNVKGILPGSNALDGYCREVCSDCPGALTGQRGRKGRGKASGS